MRKIMKLLLVIIGLFLITSVHAKTEYAHTPEFCNNFIKKYRNYQRYIVTENVNYGFDSGNIIAGNSNFKTGGLLNKYEFELSKNNDNNSTYLFNGLEYFTMTENGSNVVIVDPYSNTMLSSKSKSNSNNIRVTNYVQNGVVVTGSGTKTNPWMFQEKFRIRYEFDDKKIDIVPSTKNINPYEVVESEVILKHGYLYDSNDCGAIYNNDKLTLSTGVQDIVCNINTKLDTFIISYNSNNGENCNPSTKEVTYLNRLGTLCSTSRTGYAFNGWYDFENGGNRYDEDSIMNDDLNLYAHWNANTYTVTLNQGAGGGGSTSVTATYDTSMPSITVPSRTGYSFGGYYTEADGGGTQYYTSTGASAKNWDIAENKELYAKWTANTYTITLNRQGGTGGSTSIEATYDSSMPSISVPTKSGNTFEGYYSEANGGGTQYYDASGAGLRNWDSTTITQLFAKWKANCRDTSHTYNTSSGKCEYAATITGTYCKGNISANGTFSGSCRCWIDDGSNGGNGTWSNVYASGHSNSSCISFCASSGYTSGQTGTLSPNYACPSGISNPTMTSTLCYGSVNASKCPNSDWEIDTSKGTDGHTYKCSNSVTDTLSGTTCSYTP